MKKENLYPSECTSLLVGEKMTADGSMILARSEDWNAMFAKNIQTFEDTDKGPEKFVALDSPFRCDLPKKALGYTALSPFHLHGHWGSAGYNSLGVGMSATESIFSSDKALKADPLVENGLAENSVYNIVLPYIKTAKEGVERLGKLIEKHGVAEGFGIGFIDNDGIWYLETASGHRWLACRIPDNLYFVTGNQSRFREYDPNDKKNFMASSDLIEFAQENKLYDPKKGSFDFHEAYIRDIKLDTTYNYPRVWGLQALLSPKIKNDVKKNTFPVYAKAEKKITLDKLREVFRFHYDNTEHDPYLNNNPKEVYRPVSIFRTTQTHILHVRKNLPIEIGRINYVAFGMADLGVFLPFYQGCTEYIDAFRVGTDEADNVSAYWKFRKVMTLAMVNYNKYAPIVKKAYAEFEKEYDQRAREMETHYLKIYENSPLAAKDLIRDFSVKMQQAACDLADKLCNELFTELTKDVQAEYRFAGA